MLFLSREQKQYALTGLLYMEYLWALYFKFSLCIYIHCRWYHVTERHFHTSIYVLRIFCHLLLFSLVSVVAVLLRQWFPSQFRLTWNSLHSLS